jgi:Raf kinase inhibitor-like YbhB/YbcL family protein
MPARICFAVAAAAMAAMITMPASAGDFRLTSPDMPDGRMPAAQVLSAAYGYGGNRSPALTWEGAPAGARSFVLTVHDPDAPTGIGWTHWVVANIPADAQGLDTGASGNTARLPAGAVETRTDFGVPGYGGACPPAGTEHRYVFTLTALGVETLKVATPEAMPALIGFFANANALGKAVLEVRYGR